MSTPLDADRTSYLDLLRLDGRPFVVLGAGEGIGRQTAHALAQAGASILCVDLLEDRAAATASEVNGLAVAGDVTQRRDMERIFDLARRELGPVRGIVDIVGMAHRAGLAATSDEQWRWQFSVVVDHAFLAIQIGSEELACAGGGSMIFVGSIAGLVTTGSVYATYGPAKAALHHLVAYAAKELAPRGVRVNAVAPGAVLTPRFEGSWTNEQRERLKEVIPMERPAQPWEIAATVLALSSDLTSYVTGQVIPVDGGLAGTLRLDRV